MPAATLHVPELIWGKWGEDKSACQIVLWGNHTQAWRPVTAQETRSGLEDSFADFAKSARRHLVQLHHSGLSQ